MTSRIGPNCPKYGSAAHTGHDAQERGEGHDVELLVVRVVGGDDPVDVCGEEPALVGRADRVQRARAHEVAHFRVASAGAHTVRAAE